MNIGIDGSRAFLRYRTGIEEYSYQVIKHLRDALPAEAQVRLYVRKKIVFSQGKITWQLPNVDFPLPENWQLRGLWAPRFWTQIRLSLEMLFHPVEALFIPAHTVPVIHPKNTIVVVHGLEYEVSPQGYSTWERVYMCTSIKYSVRAAKKIISVSHNTKADLEHLYQVNPEKISVIHEGFVPQVVKAETKKPIILFIGRIEERKNVGRIIEAFEILKRAHQSPYQLILAGKPGYGYEKIQEQLAKSEYGDDIFEKGYITETEKDDLLSTARVFVFPSLYEGFGLPILEAQSYQVPVLTSNISSLPEVAGDGAVFVDPFDSAAIAEKLYQLLTLNTEQHQVLISAGQKNLERFSWQKCAEEIAQKLQV